MSPFAWGAVRAEHESTPTATPRVDRVAAVARLLRLLAAALGLAAVAGYLVVAALRLSYPYALEWLESNSLVEVQRLLTGRPLYAAPTAAYVPDGYPPLYFAVSAAVARVTGLSYLPLRLVSLVSSLVCFAVLARLVQRETASACAGIAAAGLLAATYFETDTWFDIGRVDSLFVALSVAGLYCARWARRTRGAVGAGLLLGAAFLTKQNGLAEGVAVLIALGLGSRRRLAVPAVAAYIGVIGGSTLLLGLRTHGWYVFYVFELLGEHALATRALTSFWTTYLLPTLGLALVALVAAARRTSALLVAGCGALVVEGYVALVHSGGTVNDLLPVYLAVALLAGLALGDGSGALLLLGGRALVARLRHGSGTGDRLAAAAPLVTCVAAGLVVAELVMLGVTTFQPAPAVPTSLDDAVGRRVTAGLRSLGGRVAVPADPGLDLLAGLPPVAHQGASADVLRGTNRTAIGTFRDSVARAVAGRRYTAIVEESRSDLRGFPSDLSSYYRRCPQPLLLGRAARVFTPVAGLPLRPAWLWLPIGRGSCVAATRAFDRPPRTDTTGAAGPSTSEHVHVGVRTEGHA